MSTSFERFDAWRRTPTNVPLRLAGGAAQVTPDRHDDPHLPWRDSSADEGRVAWSAEDESIVIELREGPGGATHMLSLDEAERIALGTLALVAFARTEADS